MLQEFAGYMGAFREQVHCRRGFILKQSAQGE
jgi:hypothetical protein